MKVSLCGAGIGAGGLDFRGFAELASRHGFDGIDFGVGGAMAAADSMGGVDALREWMAGIGVAGATYGLDVEWRRDQAAFDQGFDGFEDRVRFAAALGCTRCCTWMPPASDRPTEQWMLETSDRFRALAQVLGRHGARLGLEFVGPHHLRAGGANAMGSEPTVWTVDATLDLIARIGEPNVGFMVDSYHNYTTGANGDDLVRLGDDLIVHAHINDAPTGSTPETAIDNRRVLPGDGVIDLAEYVDGLRRAGYTGYVACEVLAPEPVAGDPDTAAALVRSRLRDLGL
ncbi:MAG: sugar phosphate isomerase/epimerase family protein [Armatimonadaceae bacterium]